MSIISKIVILMSFNNNNFSFAIMLMGLLCLVCFIGVGVAVWLFLVVPWVCLQFVISYPLTIFGILPNVFQSRALYCETVDSELEKNVTLLLNIVEYTI